MSDHDHLAQAYEASLAALARDLRAARDEIAAIHSTIQDIRHSSTRAAPMSALNRVEAQLEERIKGTQERAGLVEAQIEERIKATQERGSLVEGRIALVEQQIAAAAAADRANATAVTSFQQSLRSFTRVLILVAILICAGLAGLFVWLIFAVP